MKSPTFALSASTCFFAFRYPCELENLPFPAFQNRKVRNKSLFSDVKYIFYDVKYIDYIAEYIFRIVE